MKKYIFIFVAAMVFVVASCGKDEAVVVHGFSESVGEPNPLSQTSWKGNFSKRTESENGYWSIEFYILELDFNTDTTVLVKGELWETNNSIMKSGPYCVDEWNKEMRYSFSDSTGFIYGTQYSLWKGDTSAIRWDGGDSIRIGTRIGEVSIARL